MTSTLTPTATAAATSPAELGRVELRALGTSAVLLVTDRDRLDIAEAVLRAELATVDEVCSRFRADSEIAAVHRGAGRVMTVSSALAEALDAAMRAAELTDGLVDPTVADAVCALGYDRDFELLRDQDGADDDDPDEESQDDGPGSVLPVVPAPRPAPGWWRVHWDSAHREVLLPRGVSLDFGATAKALAADRIAELAAEATGCGVLVSLGGDVAMAGVGPAGGWRVAIADDHRDALATPAQTIAADDGGVATSSTEARSWRSAGRRRHHVVDPRTGDNPEPVWRTVTVAAASCLDANTASTAALVLGVDAPEWLRERGLPARLVDPDGRIVRTAGWPADEEGD
ncbi:MAG TPA: FAD:protein FMN transferase [Pseudonocardia sp.]